VPTSPVLFHLVGDLGSALQITQYIRAASLTEIFVMNAAIAVANPGEARRMNNFFPFISKQNVLVGRAGLRGGQQGQLPRAPR